MEYDFRSVGWNNQVHKAIVTLAVEQALTKIGTPVFERVCDKLFHEHHCYIPDCYENPEYLHIVLKEIFGASYLVVIESIQDNLKEHLAQYSVKNFLEVIAK
ncbi:MAG: hypothetical protein HY223_00490 [Thaumarchaeota archaeon]|nr:hypothetical protein [Nitrososphaerota archaeon]